MRTTCDANALGPSAPQPKTHGARVIPDFDHNGLLPPHGHDATKRSNRSPYASTLLEVIKKLGWSSHRRSLLMGLIDYRAELRKIGLFGVQWLDGSFVERHDKEPNDIDVVTFVSSEHRAAVAQPGFSRLQSPASKQAFGVDAYFVGVNTSETYRAQVVYWSGLFGHSREGVWKGMIEVPLGSDDADQDEHAAALLRGEGPDES
jgi:hypothetical protein